MTKNRAVTMKVDKDGKRVLKEIANELDMSMMRLTKDLVEYKEEVKRIIKNKR